MSDPVKLEHHTPLDGKSITGEGLIIKPVSNAGKIMIQRSNSVTDADMADFGIEFKKKFGTEFPIMPCHKATNVEGHLIVLCYSPSQWMLLCQDKDVTSIIAWVESAVGGKTVTATAMTDQYICLDIDGSQAHPLLAKGCAIDLRSDKFSDHHVVRTLLAQANILIWQNREGGSMILFDVSLSDYLWCWLNGASEEFISNNT